MLASQCFTFPIVMAAGSSTPRSYILCFAFVRWNIFKLNFECKANYFWIEIRCLLYSAFAIGVVSF